jgi:hypothetical protein
MVAVDRREGRSARQSHQDGAARQFPFVGFRGAIRLGHVIAQGQGAAPPRNRRPAVAPRAEGLIQRSIRIKKKPGNPSRLPGAFMFWLRGYATISNCSSRQPLEQPLKLVGTGNERDRRPTQDELDELIEYLRPTLGNSCRWAGSSDVPSQRHCARKRSASPSGRWWT